MGIRASRCFPHSLPLSAPVLGVGDFFGSGLGVGGAVDCCSADVA